MTDKYSWDFSSDTASTVAGDLMTEYEHTGDAHIFAINAAESFIHTVVVEAATILAEELSVNMKYKIKSILFKNISVCRVDLVLFDWLFVSADIEIGSLDTRDNINTGVQEILHNAYLTYFDDNKKELRQTFISKYTSA